MADYLIQQYLEISAIKYPDKIALVDGDRSVSYRKLDELSNQAANQLLKLGFQQGETVGVYLRKSIEGIIAFIGVLKAGGAYIPLDAHYSPVDRIRRIIAVSKTDYFFSDETGWNRLVETGMKKSADYFNDKKVILFDNPIDCNGSDKSFLPGPLRRSGKDAEFANRHYFDESADSDEPQTIHNITENDLAYILYTSGSTGVPKGVMITHRNAMTFINWAISIFNPPAGTIFANYAPFHFDLSVFDIYVSFAAGGVLHLVPSAVMNNPRALIEWIDDHRIEFWYSVPSVWIAVLNYAQIGSRKFENLKAVLFAGEVFPPKFIKCLIRALPGRLYYNLYGPTETNVCTYHRIKDIDEIGDDDIPIGKACENTVVVAFNERMKESAIGETGELYVRGPGVAAGYYKNSEKTNESFKSIPSSSQGDQPFYATGDIVRRISDDEYRYIGRKDCMVKCAGFRVELQEIERVLYQNPVIREAAVIPHYREDRGSVSLHAYVSYKPGIQSTISDLKKYCSISLPRYMIPEMIHVLEELPKNPNGKIDRQLLQNMCMPIGAT